MTDQVLEHEEQTEPSFEDQVVESLEARRPQNEPETGEPLAEEIAHEVASTEAIQPEVEAPPEIEDEPGEPTQASDEDRELEYARTIVKELRERPELGDALVAIKQGKASLIDRSVLEAAQEFMRNQPQPDIQAEPSDDLEDRFWQDPVAVIREVQAKTAQFEQFQRQQVEARARAQAEADANLTATVGEEWQSTHPELTEDQVVQIVQTVGETNLIARAYARHGDKNRAIREGLEAALRVEYPEIALQAQKNEAIRQANRRTRAGATAASPRSVPRRTEDPTPPRNSAGRVEFLADLIREQDAAQQ